MYEISLFENPTAQNCAFLPQVMELNAQIFGQPKTESVFRKAQNRKRSLLCVAHVGTDLAGFKLGYESDPDKFYSWIGGVKDSYRQQGIASALMKAQHEWVQRQGYARVQTRTKNVWREMLILNLRHGFDIIGTFTDDKGEPKIILEKRLI